MASYSEKLKDQRWQRKRLQILESANWRCKSSTCANDVKNPTLHVHHRFYLRGVNPWDYPDFAYVVLCEACHETSQTLMEKAHQALAQNESLLLFVASVLELDDESRCAISHSLLSACSGGNGAHLRLANIIEEFTKTVDWARRTNV